MTNTDINLILHEVKNITCCKYDRDTTLLEISKLLKNNVFHYDWVGFYLLNESHDGLILGPYSGSSTEHTFIPMGKGICGQVAQRKETMIVQDVTKVENYLSCSINVQSEIVVPILKDGAFIAFSFANFIISSSTIYPEKSFTLFSFSDSCPIDILS